MARSTTHTLRSERSFGLEIEGYGVSRAVLVTTLTLAGIACQDDGYTHATTAHWKLVSDGSIAGAQSVELVSPVLARPHGIGPDPDRLPSARTLRRAGQSELRPAYPPRGRRSHAAAVENAREAVPEV